MSEFFDSYVCRCPYCGEKFASCEGPDCDCEEEMEQEPEEADPLMRTLLDIARIPAFRAAWEGGLSAVIEKEDIRHEEF